MKVTGTKTIREIQVEFSNLFPYLKIEFYHKAHDTFEPSPKGAIVKSKSTIGDIRTIHREGIVTLSPLMTVSEFENEMKEKFGLNIQVFRKSKDIWLQTAKTDKWSLAKQNENGFNTVNTQLQSSTSSERELN